MIYELCDKANLQGVTTARQPEIIMALLTRALTGLPLIREFPVNTGSFDTAIVHRYFTPDVLDECDDIIRDELISIVTRYTPNTFFRHPPLYRFLDSRAVEFYVSKLDLTEAEDE